MKKYNLSLLFTVAMLMLGACQSPVKVEEPVNDVVKNNVEQDSLVEVAESKVKTTTYYDKSLFMLPIDHPYWKTTSLDLETIREMKERYGFTDDEVITEEDSKDVSSVEKVNGKLDSEEEATTINDNETSSTASTSTSNTNATSTKPNTSDLTTNNNSSDVTKPNNNPSSSNSSTTNKPTTPPVVEQPSEPTPPVVEETKKPVDLLDWNHIKSTLIAKGESLGMRYEDRATLEDGYESPWQSSYMTVANEDVIGYIGTQMDRVANAGQTWFALEMVVQPDGNVLIYLIR